MVESTKNAETLDDKLEGQLVKLIDEIQATSDEIESAYYHMCGVSEGPEQERILELSNKMSEISNQGYPLNRFVKIIKGLRSWENSVVEFTNFVNTLNITGKEKSMLQSIVDNVRTGELVCMVDEMPVAKFNLQKQTSSTSLAHALRVRLESLLTEIANRADGKKSISFWFEEK